MAEQKQATHVAIPIEKIVELERFISNKDNGILYRDGVVIMGIVTRNAINISLSDDPVSENTEADDVKKDEEKKDPKDIISPPPPGQG